MCICSIQSNIIPMHTPKTSSHLTEIFRYIVSGKGDFSGSQKKEVNTGTQEQVLLGSDIDNPGQIGLDLVDRSRHVYVVGKTGMGKSSLLENMIMQDIRAGRGVVLIDPHGDLYENILMQIPKSRTNDLVLFDASDTEYPVGFNILENTQGQLDSFIASGAIGVFKKIFGHSLSLIHI